jgi:hypothetical protein
MPERVGRVEHVDAGEAQERLARLSAFAEQVPGVRGAALRDLRARHDRRPLNAVEAYREASALLGSDMESFEHWSTGPDVAWGAWPTVEREQMRRRVRVVRPEPAA